MGSTVRNKFVTEIIVSRSAQAGKGSGGWSASAQADDLFLIFCFFCIKTKEGKLNKNRMFTKPADAIIQNREAVIKCSGRTARY